MLNELARVFSSNGVPVPRVGYAYAYSPGDGADPAKEAEGGRGPSGNSGAFGPIFNQASANLQLSKAGLEKAETTTKSEGSRAQLSEEQKKQVDELAKRDREVKAHESAHKAAAGGHATGGGYEYQVGPDGKQYAVGGHVSIDAGPVQGNPEATLAKAQAIRAAANAPADPSGQDRAVAAAAAQMAAQARKELAEGKSTQGGEAPRSDARIRDYGRAKAPTGSAVNAFA